MTVTVERIGRKVCAGKDLPDLQDWENEDAKRAAMSWSQVVRDEYEASCRPGDPLVVLVPTVGIDLANNPECWPEIDRYSEAEALRAAVREGQ